MRALVIGARRRRQGIGPFVARHLLEEGVELCGVVGTSSATARQARDELVPAGDSRCRAYTDLEAALSVERPDIACVCSPYEFHRKQVELIATYSCHCLCEKPFWWEEHEGRAGETARLVDRFVERDRYIGLVTQWPFTLPDFYRLHPGVEDRPVEAFRMRLGPISRGPEMVVDAAAHPLSMLQRLAGCGSISAAKADYSDADRRDLRVYFDYVHATGVIEVSCRFTTTERAPRPASYAINDREVVRTLSLPRYDISLASGDRSIRIEDPLRSLVRDFLQKVRSGARASRAELIDSVVGLEALYSAVSAAV